MKLNLNLCKKLSLLTFLLLFVTATGSMGCRSDGALNFGGEGQTYGAAQLAYNAAHGISKTVTSPKLDLANIVRNDFLNGVDCGSGSAEFTNDGIIYSDCDGLSGSVTVVETEENLTLTGTLNLDGESFRYANFPVSK